MIVFRRTLALLAGAAVLAACQHEVKSPGVTAATVSPDLVCAEQLTTRVTLTGDGFTPMPAETLNASRLVLPAVALARVKDLAGAIAAGAPVAVPDDPSNAVSSLVRWKSSQEMSFDVAPSLGLAPGFYDVRVTNPDGKATALYAAALAAVPRPVVSGLDRPAICDAQAAQTVVLTGTGFLRVGGAVPLVRIGTRSNADFVSVVPGGGCVAIPGTFSEGAVETCTTLTITIPAGLFAPGDYAVQVTNPAPAACRSSDAVTLHVQPPPTVTGTVPRTICQGGGTLQVNGSGFLAAATVDLEPVAAPSTVPALHSSSVSVEPAGTLLTAIFGGGAVAPRTYEVVVDNHDGCIDPAPHTTVVAVTGPVAFFADPEVVFTGISTTVTVYVTTLSWGPPAPTIQVAPHGQAAPLTSLTPIPVPGHPNRAQVVIGANALAPGAYDLYLDDSTTCGSVLPNAFRVTASTTVALASVDPAFGWTGASTAVTIKRNAAAAAPNDQPFVPTPRLFLNPAGSSGSPAIQVGSVSFVDRDTLTAVVPAGQLAGTYDLVVVNPNGTVGFLRSAFKVNATPPPAVASVTPSSLVASEPVNAVQIVGTDFSFASAAATCQPGLVIAPVTLGATSCTGRACTTAATIDATAVPVGSICVLRVTNADGAFFDYSALGVTTQSLNLPNPRAGSPLQKGRRALAAAAGNATPASRFLYAVGGDAGTGTSAFADVEAASVDAYGVMGVWTTVPQSTLGTARAFAGSAALGRYLYVFGGTDGATTLRSAERAMILDPAEVPRLDVGDILPADAGLDPGYWIYRVSAVFSASSLDNPGGETLPSDETILKVPSFTGKKIQVVLAWQPPTDALGVELADVAGYNVYRTPAVNGASGSEVLVAFVPGAAARQWVDDGTATPGVRRPLPFGSLGRWAQLPGLGTARRALAGAVAFDPTNAASAYVYALLGADATGAALGSYEILPVSVRPNGHQAVGTAWRPGASLVASGRSQLGAWVADHVTSGVITAPDAFVYVGGGVGAGGAGVTDVDAGKVAPGGDLGAFTAMKKFGGTQAGYGICAANGQLFTFGGANGAPSSGATSATITGAPGLANNSWNSEGITLRSPRYLSGSAVQSAFIFLVGGQAAGGAADATTELVIW